MKQAIVLIHGIGEQKPMGTLRRFVTAVLGVKPNGQDSFWSKPDRMSELFELRCLSSIGRTSAHFYEYYWAYNVEGTTVRHVLSWLWTLVRRSGKDVPESARTLWLMARALAILVLTLVVTGGVGAMEKWFSDIPKFTPVWLLMAGSALVLQFYFTRYLGDAARYCSAVPENIRLRQTIRKEGLTLLRTLHERGDYDRIIVVGHSLGSVIGYDLITRLWQEYNDKYPALEETAGKAAIRAALDRNESPQPAVRDQISHVGERLSANSDEAEVAEFQQTQKSVWLELRKLGNPWRITDFITLGSPLTHAMLLLADSREDFEGRQRQRELPTCPPQRDQKGYAYSPRQPLDLGEGKKFTPLFLHHAAPFAATRWTNLYFPTVLGFFGDFVGGPLRPVFGNGIRDVKVRTEGYGGLANITLLAHTEYWRPADNGDSRLSLPVLREALALSQLRNFRGPVAGKEKEAQDQDDQDPDG